MNAIAKFLPVNAFVPFELSQEDLATFNAWQNHTRYCYFFAVCTPDDHNCFGNWNAPFFSVDEANAFAKKIKEENPDIQLGLTQGNVTSKILTQDPENIFWEIWQNQHKKRIDNISEQKEIKAQENLERRPKLLKRLEFEKTLTNSCYYFSVFKEGKEVFPYGMEQIPYFTYEEAEKALEQYALHYPRDDFYIRIGSLDTDYMLRSDGVAEEAEQFWIDQHKQRLEILINDGEFYGRDCHFKTAQDKKEYQQWLKSALNSTEVCHLFIVKSLRTPENREGISSPYYFSIVEAMTAKAKFEMLHPKREFSLERKLMSANNLMALDGRTIDFFQDFIDEHKARLQSLSKESAA